MDSQDQNQSNGQARKFLGIQFECCGAYSRIYLNERLQAYTGNCPRCFKAVKILVDSSRATTSSRFFKAR